MATLQRSQKTVIPHLLLLYLIWGFNWVVMRMANEYFPPVFFVAVRFSIGAIALLIVCALAFLLWNYILTNMEAGQASIAVMGVPAVGVLSGVVVLHEPMSWSIALGMVLIFIGIFAVLGFGAGKNHQLNL